MPKVRTLTDRLSAGLAPEYAPPADSRFVARLREALYFCRESGPRFRRARYAPDNCWPATAEHCLVEMLAAGEAEENLLRIGDAFRRAVRELLRARHPRQPAAPETLERVGDLIEQETASNGHQNVRSDAVLRRLPHAGLAELESLWETTRAQITASERLLAAIEARAQDLAGAATHA